jgi:hypothetical protein
MTQRNDEFAEIIARTVAAKAEATRLLCVLEAQQAEAVASGGSDLYKRVTGASSIENALAETKRSIDACDRLIDQVERMRLDRIAGLHPQETAPEVHTPNVMSMLGLVSQSAPVQTGTGRPRFGGLTG